MLRRRYAARALIACAVALSATLSSVRAGQLWTQSRAQAHASQAAQQAHAALEAARRDGLRGSGLRTLSDRLQALNARKAPALNVLWGASQETFYSVLSNQLIAFRGQIGDVVARVEAKKRLHITNVLHHIADLVRRQQELGSPVGAEIALSARVRTALAGARTVGGLRLVGRHAHTLLAQLSAGLTTREAQVAAVITSSGNTVPGIRQTAESDISNVRANLSLLAIFSKAGDSDTGVVDSEERSLLHASSTTQAAIVALAIRSERESIQAKFAQIVPDKVIVVSTEDQTARAYDHGKPVFTTPVTTGGPELPTDHGIFHIFEKISPFVFHSPFPLGSPYYYSPTPVQFWMPFDQNEGLHDASWRSNFGPGSDLQPTDLGNGNTILGTHGCVNMPYASAQFIWNWAPLGTTVAVV